MKIPSEFLKQHIGTVEMWIEQYCQGPHIEALILLGCDVTNGVIVHHKDLGLELTPRGLSVDLSNSETAERSLEILREYICHLQKLDPTMVNHAHELDQKREEFNLACIREQIYPGGSLWWRNANGVWHIKIMSVHGTSQSNTKIHFQILNSINNEVGDQRLRFMNLFLTEKEACDPTREGYHVK